MAAFFPAIGAGLAKIGTFMTGPVGIGLMAVAGVGQLVGSSIKKRNMLRDQQEQAAKNLEEAKKMRAPKIPVDPVTDQIIAESNELIQMGRDQARTGLNQTERNLVMNRIASQNRFSNRAGIGSALRRIQESEGIMQLGATMAQARRQGAEVMASGMASKQKALSERNVNRRTVFAAANDRYNAIQTAAGQAFAQAQQNQLAQQAANQQLGASLLSLAMQTGRYNPQSPGGGSGFTPNSSLMGDAPSLGGGGIGTPSLGETSGSQISGQFPSLFPEGGFTGLNMGQSSMPPLPGTIEPTTVVQEGNAPY